MVQPQKPTTTQQINQTYPPTNQLPQTTTKNKLRKTHNPPQMEIGSQNIMQQTIREGHNPYNNNYVQDSQKPGPSKTHTIEEINEIL